LKGCFKAAPSISPKGEEMEKIEANIVANLRLPTTLHFSERRRVRDEVKIGLTTGNFFSN